MLESDPKRQAIYSLRGYAYQIWQSLDLWLSLSEEEILYLEGAEDIDKLAPGDAETIQVKDLQSGHMTLNSPEILDAINHYWEHKTKNTQIRIKYRFLTTAVRGEERPAVFAVKGLDYWDKCKNQITDLQPIRNFLLSKDSLHSGLKEFIKDSNDESFRNDIIRPIEWDTGNPIREYLEDIIVEKLKKLGGRFGIFPSASAKVLPALLKYVFEKASSEADRSLTCLDLNEQFEANTTVNVPINRMTQALSAMGRGFEIEGLMGTMSSVSGIIPIDLSHENISPTVPSKFSKRKSIVESLAKKLLADKLLVLYGSTGMGKSSIGVLLVESLALTVHWLNLRGYDANSIKSMLMRIALNLENFDDNILVIDDLSFGPDFYIYENAFIALLSIVLSRNGYIIVTTQNELPDKVSHHIYNIKDLIVTVPVMELDEIKELTSLHGCSNEKERDLWSSFIQMKTGGHPQLVHAKIRSLEASGWPTPTFDSLTKPDDLETIKSEVKKRLIAELAIESARTLSYRLSIFNHPFKKSHALKIGEKSPAIPNPGEAFDLLVGPWVERLTSGYYRISPLLRNMASDIWSSDEVKNLEAQAVIALLSEKTLSHIEASNAFYHGLFGECEELLMPLIMSLLTTNRNVLPDIAEDLRLLTVIALSPGQKRYPKNPIVSLSLRQIQFRVASEIDKKDTAPKIALAWEEEINELEPGEFRNGAQILFLAETLMRFEVLFPLATVIDRTKQLYMLLTDTANKYNDIIVSSIQGKELIAHIALFAIARCENYTDLLEFLTAIDQEDKAIKDLYLSFLGTEEDWANFVIGKVYLHEVNAISPEWRQCLNVFSRTIELSRLWSTASLTSNAYHMIAVIYDEHLEDATRAISILDQAREVLGNNNPIIEDARSMIYFRQKNYGEVLGILDKILNNWHATFDPAPLLAYRRAEISAARLGNWEKAASLAFQAIDVARSLGNTIKEVGFKADHAFALWKSGDRQKSLDFFVNVLQAFDRLPNPQNDLHSHALQKNVGHAVVWMLNDIKEDHIDSHVEPYPACFTNDEFDERIKQLPLQSIEFFWMILAQIEMELGVNNNIFIFFNEMFSSSKYPVIRIFIHEAKIIHSLRSGDFRRLVIDYYDFVSCIQTSKKLVRVPNDVLRKIDIIEPAKVTDDVIESLVILFGFALIILLHRGEAFDETVSLWRADSKNIGILNASLLAWFDLIEKIATINEHDLTRIMSDGAAGTGERMVASLMLLKSKKVSPQITFYSHLMLFNIACDRQSIWGKEVEDQLEKIITPVWIEIANTKAFSLLNPMRNIPMILEACKSDSFGFNKIAKVLYVAKDSVNLIIPQNMLLALKNELK